jgi:hypothetical protein
MVSTRSELVPVAAGTPLPPVSLTGPSVARATLLRDPLRPYVFFELDTGSIFTLPAGADPTDSGAWDQSGGSGSSSGAVHETTGAPSAGLGVDGDWAIDKSNPTALTIYGPKAAGAWGVSYPLTGPQGPQGDTGATGATGPSGAGVVGDSAVPYETAWPRPQRWRKLAGSAVTHTETINAAYLQYTTTAAGTQQVGPSIPIQQLANRTVVFEATFPDPINTATGMLLGVGGLTYGTLDAANAVVIVWRSNGAIVVANSAASTITTWTVTPGTYNLPSHTWVQNDILRIVWKFGADASSATATLFKNGVPTGQVFTISGLTEGCIWAGGRLAASGQTVRIRQLTVLNNYQTGEYFIDPTNVGSYDGTETLPFPSFATAFDFINATGLKSLIIHAKGEHRGRTVDVSDFDTLDVRASTGDPLRIYGSTLVTSGWTATVGATGVWERAGWLYDGVLNQPGGGVIDPSRVDGPRPFTMYSRAATNTAPAALVEGETSIHTTGGNAQKLFIKTWGGVDPNTLSLELVDRSTVFAVRSGSDTFKTSRVKLTGAELRYSGSYAVALDRVDFEFRDVVAQGSLTLSLFALLDSGGTAEACAGIGAYNDAWATVQSSSGPVTRRPRVVLKACRGLGSVVGDGVSCHDNALVVLLGGEYSDNGKDGVVFAPGTAGGRLEAYGVVADRNGDSNFKNAGDPGAGIEQVMLLSECQGDGALVSVNTNNATSALGLVSTEVRGGKFTNATNRKFQISNSNAGDATRVQLTTIGVEVGGTGTNVVNNGGTHVNIATATL